MQRDHPSRAHPVLSWTLPLFPMEPHLEVEREDLIA